MKQLTNLAKATVHPAMERLRRLALLSLALMLCTTMWAQSGINIKGTVVDSNGEALIGASVVMKGNTAMGTVTDFDGNFSLNVPSESTVIVISYVGMNTREIRVGKQRVINVTLTDNTQLTEVVVVGYGQQKKASVVGAITQTTGDFFWQDYMGDLEYVRTAVRLTRKYGGNDLKLFANDYNLESDWDQNQKLKSLIKWIEKWEADGVTKIDGIGSQMHISYYLDPKTQESKQKAIEESFKLMAASGKLVRISELDMGLVDEDGNDVKTADVTEEQHHKMAEFYTWIIKKYKELIPAAQQWGVCQWCATDSPANSGWRANQPVGLWDQNFYRKHTYAGFADGLKTE